MWRGMFHECGHCVWDAGCLSHAGGGGLLLEGPERLPQRACQPAASRMLLCLSGAAHMRCHELQVSWCVWESGSACFMSYGPWARQRLREAMGPSEIGRNGMGLSARRSAAPRHPLLVVLRELVCTQRSRCRFGARLGWHWLCRGWGPQDMLHAR